MGLTKLTALISLIVALSIASERLVEIIKGFSPYLGQQKPEQKEEGRRRSSLQILAVASAMFTTWLARDYIPAEFSEPSQGWSILGLGLLASGGSGFWNSILAYLAKVKDVKSLELLQMKKNIDAS
jgi:hypothetical protein